MFQRASRFVYALSSTASWYSSGPTTTRMWQRPSRSRAARDAQKRAVSSISSTPMSTMNSSSAGRLPVLPDRPGDVGGDVVLHEAGEDGHLSRRPGRCRTAAWSRSRVSADSHGKSAPRWPMVRAFCARAGQVVVAVLEQRARVRRQRVDEERDHEDLGVPEDVTEVGHAGEAAGADRHVRVVRLGAGDHVVDGEAGRQLRLGVAVDAHVAGAPAALPHGAVAAQQLVVARADWPRSSAARADGAARRPRAGGDDGGQPVDTGRLAAHHPPADHVARLLHARARAASRGSATSTTARVCPPPLRPRVHASRPAAVEALDRGLGDGAAGVRDAETALPLEIARRPPPGGPRPAGPAAARSASEAKRAVRTRTSRPVRSRCSQSRKTRP